MSTALDRLIERYVSDVSPLHAEYVSEWQSPIYVNVIDDDVVEWQPVKQQPPLDFSPLEAALELTFHEHVKSFYGRWFSGDLAVSVTHNDEQHGVSLLQAQGPEDAERLLQNITGHILMKRKLKQPETVFIGLVDEADDLLLSIDNATGAIGLEWIGKPQHEVLYAELDDFLAACTPVNLAK